MKKVWERRRTGESLQFALVSSPLFCLKLQNQKNFRQLAKSVNISFNDTEKVTNSRPLISVAAAIPTKYIFAVQSGWEALLGTSSAHVRSYSTSSVV